MPLSIPKSPPETKDLLQKYGSRLEELLAAGFQLPEMSDYLHWDELRFRKPPPAMSLEEWWLTLKIRRKSAAKLVPLLDQKGTWAWFCLSDGIQDWLHRFDIQTGEFGAVPAAIQNEANRSQYLTTSLIEEAFTSSVLEGAVSTREAAKEMIKMGRGPRDKSERMILNNYRTMEQLREWKNQPMSVELLCALHLMITEGTLSKGDAEGRLRNQDERVEVADEIDDTIYYTPPPHAELPDRLKLLCDFANSVQPTTYIHPVLRAVILHFTLSYIHPFYDGNGRAARALFYWSVMRSGYWQFEYISISHVIRKARAQYPRAFLYVETDEMDLTYFIGYHLRVVDLAMRDLLAYIGRKQAEVRAFEKQLRMASQFNHRQQALLVHALKHPYFQYTIEGHQKSHQIVYDTAWRDLKELERAGLLNRSRVSKAYRFTPVPSLSTILGKSGVSGNAP